MKTNDTDRITFTKPIGEGVRVRRHKSLADSSKSFSVQIDIDLLKDLGFNPKVWWESDGHGPVPYMFTIQDTVISVIDGHEGVEVGDEVDESGKPLA